MKYSLILLASLAACGGDDAPPQDAAPQLDARQDAPLGDSQPAQCTTPGECPCFSNDDCPDGTRCHAAAPDNVYCEPGARGTGAPGSTCTGENDCDSALCVDAEENTQRCSRTCTTNEECPAELPRCLNIVGICARDA